MILNVFRLIGIGFFGIVIALIFGNKKHPDDKDLFLSIVKFPDTISGQIAYVIILVVGVLGVIALFIPMS